MPTRASPFCGFTRSQLPPSPKGSPGGGQPVLNPADGPLPPPNLPTGLFLATLLAPGLLLPAPPLAEPRGHRRLPACAGRELSTVHGKCQGRSAWFSSITETALDLEVVGPRGPKATSERKSPLTCICMTVPDCLKILGGNSAFA